MSTEFDIDKGADNTMTIHDMAQDDRERSPGPHESIFRGVLGVPVRAGARGRAAAADALLWNTTTT